MDSRERRQKRRERLARLQLIQQRIIAGWMPSDADLVNRAPTLHDRTWVSGVGIDDQTQTVTVSLNRRDQEYAGRLIAEFGDDIQIEPDPVTVTALPPGGPVVPPWHKSS